MAGPLTRRQQAGIVAVVVGGWLLAIGALNYFVDESSLAAPLLLLFVGALNVGSGAFFMSTAASRPWDYDMLLAWWPAVVGLLIVGHGVVGAFKAETMVHRAAWLLVVPTGILTAVILGVRAWHEHVAHKAWLAAGRPRPEEPASP